MILRLVLQKAWLVKIVYTLADICMKLQFADKWLLSQRCDWVAFNQLVYTSFVLWNRYSLIIPKICPHMFFSIQFIFDWT